VGEAFDKPHLTRRSSSCPGDAPRHQRAWSVQLDGVRHLPDRRNDLDRLLDDVADAGLASVAPPAYGRGPVYALRPERIVWLLRLCSPRSLGDAGLDVRLSSSFIAFKHSATAVFDAIEAGQDPRG
jgi:hypothetical protein